MLIGADGTEIKRVAPGTVSLPVEADGQTLRVSFGSDVRDTLVAVLAPAARAAFEVKVVPSENGWTVSGIDSGLAGKLLVDNAPLAAGTRLVPSGAAALKSDGTATATVSWVKGANPVAQGSKADSKEIAKVEPDAKQVAPVVEGEPGANVGIPPVYIGSVPDPASSTYTTDDTFDRTFLLTGERKRRGGNDSRDDTTNVQPQPLPAVF